MTRARVTPASCGANAPRYTTIISVFIRNVRDKQTVYNILYPNSGERKFVPILYESFRYYFHKKEINP
jgi:hypothetical protein